MYLVAGVGENEGMIPIMEKYRELSGLEDSHHILVTNSKNYQVFQGETYFYQTEKDLSLLGAYRELMVWAQAAGLFETPDMFIIGGFYPVTVLMTLAIDGATTREKNRSYCTRPIIIMNPKIPEDVESDMNVNRLDLFWWMLGHYPNITLAVGQLKNEMVLAEKALTKHYPKANFQEKLKPFVEYLFDETLFSSPETIPKEDKVIWTGRWNSLKQPELALKVMTLLEAQEKKCEMWIPASGASKLGAINQAKNLISEVHLGEERSVFWNKASKAKVILITPKIDGFGTGLMEMISRGVVPVIFDAPWLKDYISINEDWPLTFKQPGEGAELCIEALNNYDHYADLLRSNLKQRYSKPYDWDKLVVDAWNRYCANNQSYEFSLQDLVRGGLNSD